MKDAVIAVHDGKFHADDVFAVAALLTIFPGARVIRTRDKSEINKATFAVDVGGQHDPKKDRFDHHQGGGAGERPNGIPYAAFGLVWKKYGKEIAGSTRAAEMIDDLMISPMDANDNGVDISRSIIKGINPYDISDAVRAFTPTWEEPEGLNDYFGEAVEMAKKMLAREIKRVNSRLAGEKKVLSAYKKSKDKRLVVLDDDYSWKEILAKFPEPLYVILPQEDKWNIYCVRDDPNKFKNRKDLPLAWAGLGDEKLSKVTGVSDAVFCHRNAFMAIAKSKEGVLRLASIALTQK